MSIGAKIKEIRESKGVMQKRIEEELNQYQGWLSRVENGKQEIMARELFIVAQVLSTPLEVFYLSLNIADSDKNIHSQTA